MPSDAWTLVREFALKAPPAIVADVLLGALRRQDEARLETAEAVSHAPGTWPPPVPAPPKRKPGRPPGRKAKGRRGRPSRRRDVSKAAEPASTEPKAANGNGDGRARSIAALNEAKKIASQFWTAAEAKNGGAPWDLVARTFDILPALALDGRRHTVLPRGVSIQAARDFIAGDA